MMNDKYKIIGPLYDFLAMIFSAGQIDKCKTAMHEYIKQDDKVLFAGVGQGIDAIKAAGLRNQVKIMIGGGQIDEEVKRYTGADAYRPDAVSAVTLAKEWVGAK